LRIFRVITFLDFGGVEQVLANSVPELIQSSNLKVKVVVLGNGGRVQKELVQKGVDILVLDQNPRIPNLKLILKLLRLIKEFQPDVVHCQAAEANFHGVIAARMAGVPVRIGEEIGFPNHHTYWKYIFKLVYKNATKVIAISQAVKNRIVELGEVEEEKVEVVYNPVSIGERKILRFAQNDRNNTESEREKVFVFVTTCRLVPVKNLDSLLNAFERLCQEFSEKNTGLWIVGDGPLKINLENQSKQLGIENKVKYWGFQENVFPFLEKADAFILPSLSEGSSVSLVEAMSMGLPSIVTEVGGTKEIIGNSNSAIFIDPLDEGSIFKALSACMNLSNEQREILGKSAINESKRFSIDHYIKKLLDVYSYRGV
jgi:glycosyltransferase involved in cell wall biosynthesis